MQTAVRRKHLLIQPQTCHTNVIHYAPEQPTPLSIESNFSDESFGSPGSPPSSPLSLSLSPVSSPLLQPSKVLEMSNRKRYNQLADTTKEVAFYCKQLKKQEKTMNNLEKECNRKIHSIRNIWKHKIYEEGTRGGKILEMAMQDKIASYYSHA